MSQQRTRAWRRAQRHKHGADKPLTKKTGDKPEKSWKLLWARSLKLHRAQKIGKLWPYREWRNHMDED